MWPGTTRNCKSRSISTGANETDFETLYCVLQKSGSTQREHLQALALRVPPLRCHGRVKDHSQAPSWLEAVLPPRLRPDHRSILHPTLATSKGRQDDEERTRQQLQTLETLHTLCDPHSHRALFLQLSRKGLERRSRLLRQVRDCHHSASTSLAQVRLQPQGKPQGLSERRAHLRQLCKRSSHHTEDNHTIWGGRAVTEIHAKSKANSNTIISLLDLLARNASSNKVSRLGECWPTRAAWSYSTPSYLFFFVFYQFNPPFSTLPFFSPWKKTIPTSIQDTPFGALERTHFSL